MRAYTVFVFVVHCAGVANLQRYQLFTLYKKQEFLSDKN